MRKYFQGLILSTLLAAPVVAMGAGEYEGERNSFGRFHGQGAYTTSRGDTYEGNWVDGRKSGKGTYVWKNGDKYVGEWKNNKRNGEGEMFYATGNVYKGEWSANKARGEGVMRYKNKDVYKGLFKNGVPGGQGKMVYANGDRYVGNWVDGLPSGKGAYHLKNGDKVFANWKAGDIEKGSTKYRFAKGIEYKGPLKKLAPNGKGTCTEKGKSSPCQYRNGKLVVAKVAPKPVVAKPKPVQVAKVEAKPRPKPAPKPVVVPSKPKVYMSDKVEFNLEHDWVNAGRFGAPTEIVCKVIEDDLDDTKALHITAKSGEMSVRMKVNDYRGVGEYALPFYSARAKFKEVGGYATTDEKPGKLVVTRDNGKLISAIFSFESYPNGNVSLGKQHTIKNGRITAKPIFE
jgi:hypothetical protein